MSFTAVSSLLAFPLRTVGQNCRMSKSLKIILAFVMLSSAVLGYVLTRPAKKPARDGTELFAKAEKSLEALPPKEAEQIRLMLTNQDDLRYDDRVHVWFKGALNEKLQPAVDYAMAELRAWSDQGDLKAMYALHFVLIQRIATADEGFALLRKAASLGEPTALFQVTEHDLQENPELLRKAMEELVKRNDFAGYRALHWFAKAHEDGLFGLEKDPAKSADYRARAKTLEEKIRPRRKDK